MSDEAYRVCPTCGTRAYARPDRQVGEDALDIPDEVIERGATALRTALRGFTSMNTEHSREIAVVIFKTMAHAA